MAKPLLLTRMEVLAIAAEAKCDAMAYAKAEGKPRFLATALEQCDALNRLTVSYTALLFMLDWLEDIDPHMVERAREVATYELEHIQNLCAVTTT